jgi:hypothetical protein
MLHVCGFCVMTASLLSTVSHLYQAVYIVQAPGMKHGFFFACKAVIASPGVMNISLWSVSPRTANDFGPVAEWLHV